MKLSISFLCLLLCWSVNAKVYSGKCPLVVSEAKEIGCPKSFRSKLIGEVSTSAATLNLFHNQYKYLHCMNVDFSCHMTSMYYGELMKQCWSEEKIASCYGTRIKKGQNETSGAYSLEYFFAPGYTCREDLIRDEIYILDYIPETFILIWGCWEIDPESNEQGVLVLLAENLRTKEDFKERSKHVVKKINPDLENDLSFLTTESNTTCVCEDCNYLAFCHLDPEVDNCYNYTMCKTSTFPTTLLDDEETTSSGRLKQLNIMFFAFA